jgi:hypothetical protein
VTGGLSKLHYEELHDLCFLRNIIRVIKSRSIGGGGGCGLYGTSEKSI